MKKTLQKTLETIKKHNLIENNMHIVIGLSGGPDSVCLFDIFRQISTRDKSTMPEKNSTLTETSAPEKNSTLTETSAPQLNLTLHAVHVNHKFRPGAAEEDQRYVEELCEAAGVECHSFVVDCNELAKREGLTSEEAGRKARYDAFSEVADQIHQSGVPKEKIAIALAHNANDQCETILFRLMRGTGTDGLAGIPYKRFDEKGFAIIRPIMDLKRDEIEKYCEEANLSPRIDHTNDENIYARNKIRNMLIPFIEENFNESIIDTVNRLGKVAADDRDYLKTEARCAYEDAVGEEACSANPSLDCDVLKELHKSIRFRVYGIALDKLGMVQGLTFAQGEAVDAVLNSDSPSAVCDLGEGYVAARQYHKLVFDRQMTYGTLEKEVAQRWQLLALTPAEFEEYKENSKGEAYGAFQGVSIKELMVRTRKAGDRIKLANGSKKLQDFFVDQKVPKAYRDEVLLLAKGSDVLWVLPSPYNKGRFGAGYGIDKNSQEPIILLKRI